MSLLFSPFQLRNLTLKNRIVMSPMCMYSCYNEDGKVTDWHKVHYTSRADGQAALIMVEATAVTPQGRITVHDLGIWSDDHIQGFKELVDLVHSRGAKIGIQLAHAGRKADVPGPIIAPSPLPFKADSPIPQAMDEEMIQETIAAFQKGAQRARQAGFDVVEIHAAHGFLIHEFLSPLSNKRTDRYGGSEENRYRFLQEVIEAVRKVWDGPLFVRISASDYHPEGLKVDDYVRFGRRMKEQGVDLIDCSSGGLIVTEINTYPGYQVPFAEKIKAEVGIPTGAVGLITQAQHAEEILQNGRADLIFLGRELLRDPYWPLRASRTLQVSIPSPRQYERGWRG